jgi:cytochrome c oxidase cbb3-type subunit 1
MQGLMWRDVNADGTLVYSFVESVKATFPFYVIRLAGGVLYLGGMLLMAWNVVMTARAGPETETEPDPARLHADLHAPRVAAA